MVRGSSKFRTVVVATSILFVVIVAINCQSVSGETPQIVSTTASIIKPPNPVGINETVQITLRVFPLPLSANESLHGLQYIIKSPDGTSQMFGPFTADANGEYIFPFTPTQLGNYTIEFSYPGETFSSTNTAYMQSKMPATIQVVLIKLPSMVTLGIAIGASIGLDAAIFLIANWIIKRQKFYGFCDILRDESLRPSLSRFQFLAWTAIIIFCFLTITFTRIGSGLSALTPDIPQNLLILLGISAAVTPVSTAISISKKGEEATSKKPEAPNTVAALAEAKPDQVSRSGLTKDQITNLRIGKEWAAMLEENGMPSVNRFQMLSWTVVGIASYLVIFFFKIGTFAAVGTASDTTLSSLLVLPDIDITLVALMGLSQGAYIGGKTVAPKKTILYPGISQNPVTEGLEVTIRGANFGTDKGAIRVGNKTISPNDIVWADTSITFKAPKVEEVSGDGTEKEEYVQILISGKTHVTSEKLLIKKIPQSPPVPTIQEVTKKVRQGQTAFVFGSNFGKRSNGKLIFNGQELLAADWLGWKITFKIPDDTPPDDYPVLLRIAEKYLESRDKIKVVPK